MAAFDVNPGLVGTRVNGVPICHLDTLEEFLRDSPASVGVLTVPAAAAAESARRLAACGVAGIWNFTNVELTEPNSTTIVENIHFSDSLLALSYYVAERMDEKSARTDKA